MVKTPSMAHQVTQIAKDHIAYGQSKYDSRMEQLQKGVQYTEATRDKLFSFRTTKEFVAASIRFSKWVKETYGTKMVGGITPAQFDAYWKENVSKLAPTTQKTYLDHLSRFDKYVKEKGWGDGFITSSNKPIIVKGWKSVRNRTDRAMAHTPESMQDLIKSQPQYENAITFLAEMGLRAKEIQQMKFSDVKNGILQVIGKGGRPREVTLTKTAARIIEDQKKKHKILSPSAKVFQKREIDSLRRAIHRHNQEHHLPGRSLHSFRHLYAHREYGKEYRANRIKGLNRRDAARIARGSVSALLGHGKPWQDQGRISVTYAYVSGTAAKSIESQIEAELASKP